MTIKIGVIGAGGMLQYHAAGFRAAGAEILAICDMNQTAAKKQQSFMMYRMYFQILRKCLIN